MAIREWKNLLRSAAFAGLGFSSVMAGAQPPAGHGPYFPPDAPWYRDVSTAPVDPESPAVIAWLASVGGWGNEGVFQIDFSIEVLEANASTPFRTFIQTGDFFDPDCDDTPVPVPPGGALEGEDGYECESDGDCHLIVVHPPSNLLFEMWRANIDAGNNFFGGCLAVWDMNLTYPPMGRGHDCSSADAAGYPMAPLLFSADEVAAGEIDHAMRFALPNSRIRRRVYVHPSTHSTNSTTGPATAPPYGARLRLRANYPLQNLPNEGARVVARALQKYGMLLSDGGQIALMGQSDRFTTAKWDSVLGEDFPHVLQALQVTDFQVVDAGQRFNYTGDCERIAPIFFDGFELGTSKWSGTVP
jgi:hypothetical protein